MWKRRSFVLRVVCGVMVLGVWVCWCGVGWSQGAQELVLDPGGFVSTWAWLPSGRGGEKGLVKRRRVMPLSTRGDLRPLDTLMRGDLVASPDIRARAPEEFWVRGGVAFLWVASDRVREANVWAGLPPGAHIQLNGQTVLRTGRNSIAPDSVHGAIEIPEGISVLTVSVPASKPIWYGRGFHLRFMDASHKPLRGLRMFLPTPKGVSALGLLQGSASVRRVGEGWVVRTSFVVPPALPKVLAGRSVSVAVEGEHTASKADVASEPCILTPGARCVRDVPIDLQKNTSLHTLRAVLRLSVEEQHTLADLRYIDPSVTTQDLGAISHLVDLIDASYPNASTARSTYRFTVQAWEDSLQSTAPTREVPPIATLRSWLQAQRARLQGPSPELPVSAGLHTRATQSPFDRRYQPYTLVLPPNAKSNTPKGLVIALHGYRGSTEKICRAVLGKIPPEQLDQIASIPFIIACPFGYGDTAFRYIGEDDLLRTLHAVQNDFTIDPNTIYLTGASDGGLATFEVALHHPDLWAAVAPLGAVSDMRAFPAFQRPLQPYEDAWLRRVSAHDRAINGHTLPFFIAFGANDRLDSKYVEHTARHLQKHSAPSTRTLYTLHKDLGHNVWDRTYARGALLQWFAKHTRPPSPPSLSFTTHTPRYHHTHDLTLHCTQHTKHNLPATVHINRTNPHHTHLQANPQVLAFSFSLTALSEPGDTVKIGTQTLPLPPSSQHVILLRDTPTSPFTLRTSPTPLSPHTPTHLHPQGRRSKHRHAGPIDELRAAGRIYVYGSQDPHHTLLNRYLAHLDQLRWSRTNTLQTRVIPDTELTPNDRASHTLLLYGTPSSNPWIQHTHPQALSSVPSPPQPNEPRGLRARFPNPDAPGLHTILSSGLDPRGPTLAVHLPEILPDSALASPLSVSPPFGLTLGPRPLSVHTVPSSHQTTPSTIPTQPPTPCPTLPAPH